MPLLFFRQVCGSLLLFGAALIISACALHADTPKPDSAVSAPTRGEAARVEFTSLTSLSLGDGGQLVPGPPVTLVGVLVIPPGSGPFPAVVLMHGCSGVHQVEHGWEAALGQAGYATFMVNSLGGRGLGAVCSDAGGLSASDRIADAYGALRTLSTHPRIDRERVALMGFSHGGVVTTMSATAWAKHVFVLAGQPSFRAFVAFYPYCNWTFPEMWQLSGPLRVHSGALDDWTPAKPCQEMVARLRTTGYDAEISVYRAARHAFDNGDESAEFLPNVLNPAACAPRLGSILGPLKPEHFAACLRRGATIGGNRAAMAQARAAVLAQLAELLK